MSVFKILIEEIPEEYLAHLDRAVHAGAQIPISVRGIRDYVASLIRFLVSIYNGEDVEDIDLETFLFNSFGIDLEDAKEEARKAINYILEILERHNIERKDSLENKDAREIRKVIEENVKAISDGSNKIKNLLMSASSIEDLIESCSNINAPGLLFYIIYAALIHAS